MLSARSDVTPRCVTTDSSQQSQRRKAATDARINLPNSSPAIRNVGSLQTGAGVKCTLGVVRFGSGVNVGLDGGRESVDAIGVVMGEGMERDVVSHETFCLLVATALADGLDGTPIKGVHQPASQVE